MRSLAVAVLLTLGCGQDEPSTAIRIELVPNAAFNTRQEVLAALDAIEIVVDGIEHPLLGLPSEPGRIDVRTVAEDRDTDPSDLELVYTLELGHYTDLPLLQFEPGSNGDQPLLFRIFGLDVEGMQAASGQVVVAFTPGEIVAAQAPFNLRAAYRVPRVVAVQPDPDAVDVSCDATLRVTFSEPMQPTSTLAAVVLRDREGVVDGEATLVEGSIVEFLPAADLAPGPYSLEVLTSAQDEHGDLLDQDPYRDEAQPFRSTFTVVACP